MNLNGKSVAELQQLLVDVSDALQQAQRQAESETATRREQIGAAIDGLTGLLGPADAQPGVDSIRAVRAYDTADQASGRDRGQTMAENAGLALSLAFEALEAVTDAARNIAIVVSDN